MRNVCLTLAYDGTDFHGWQRQAGLARLAGSPRFDTIQGCVEEAIARIIGERVVVNGSGRTDAGVHALAQVANFKTSCRIPCANLVKALNDGLPAAIRVKEAREVASTFHARYDARSKTYRYRILQSPVGSPFLGRFSYHYPYSLNHHAMSEAARALEGEHDFTSFAAERPGFGTRVSGFGKEEPIEKTGFGSPGARLEAKSSSFPSPESRVPNPGFSNSETRTPNPGSVRTIFSSRLLARPQTSMLIYEVRGSGFLHHMVRNIVGTLIEVGRGKLAPSDLRRILDARDRRLAGPTAPAQGLCLVRVEY